MTAKKKVKLERIKEDYEGELPEAKKSAELTRNKKLAEKGKWNLFKFPWKQKKLLEKFADKSYVITMMFPNGTSRTFVIKTSERSFRYQNKTYFLYIEEAFYDLSMRQYHLYYFQRYAVPINREIQQDGDEAYFSATPENLKKLQDSDYVKALVNSNSVSNTMAVLMVLNVLMLVGMGALMYKVYSG